MSPSPTVFDQLETTLAAEGAPAAMALLVEHLRREALYHELFDARLLEARHRLGLPLATAGALDDLPEPTRTSMEEAYLAACREVGGLLLDAGRVREAWMYLRPVGEKPEVARAIESLYRRESSATPSPPEQAVDRGAPDEASAARQNLVEQVIEVALYEGVCPSLGFELVLDNYGTCNAISLFDAQMHARPLFDKQQVAGLLVRRLHDELERGVRADIARREDGEPPASTLQELVASRPELFEHDNYHVDTTHLAAVVRFALCCDDAATLRLALDLTEYGRRLSTQYQFAGQEPFAETYPAYGRFFRALLEEEAEEALAYFRRRADALRGGESGMAAAEVLVGLLARMGRTADALEESAARLGPSGPAAGFAPGLVELAVRADKFDRLKEIARHHGDPVGFATGLLGAIARAPQRGGTP